LGFEQLEQRLNQVAATRLSNATGVFGFGEVRGIFTNPYELSQRMVDNADPSFTVPSSYYAQITKGMAVTINSVAYVVKSREPDGSGWIRLNLELDE